MPRDVFTRREWERAWRDVELQFFADFCRAGDEESALRIWRESRVIDEARIRLAKAMAGNNEELQRELEPMTSSTEGSP